MRPEGGCSNKNSSDYQFHRMHYCGVCKTMGKNYGHKSRFLLNYDSVFLAELMSELNREDLNNWENSLQAINKCLKLCILEHLQDLFIGCIRIAYLHVLAH